MSYPIQITYLAHSGFAVSIRDTLLVFDDAQGPAAAETAPEEGRVTRSLLDRYQRTLFFVSHAHADHFNPSIYRFADESMVHYVLGSDVPERYSGHHMKKGDTLSLGGADITAYGSTDEGVSFLVRLEGWTLFHAGDLNLWHWRDESSVTEIEAAERAFYDCVAPIPKQKIDVAFFPVDPRQGSMYDAGAGYFIMTVKPKVFIPMHFQGRPDVALRFAVTGETPQTRIVALEQPGDHIDLHLPEDETSAPDQKLKDLLKDDENS